MHLLTGLLVGVFSQLQKLRPSLTSVCRWCVDVTFHRCVEGASTLIVLLENKTIPCSLSHLWLETHPQSSVQGPQHWRSIHLPLYLTSPWLFVPHTIAVLHSHLGRAAFVGCGKGPSCTEHLHKESVWDLDEPTCHCPFSGWGLLFSCSAQGKVVLRKVFEPCW